MSYPIEQLPDISHLGGEWTTAVVADAAWGHPVRVGRAVFPDHEWRFGPGACTWGKGARYLDETLLLCMGCGCDGT
ncbi:hypothetical protein [Nocardia rhamnosiphila]